MSEAAHLLIEFFTDNPLIEWDEDCNFDASEEFCCDMCEYNGCIKYKMERAEALLKAAA